MKIYVSHRDAGPRIAHHAALAVPGADPDLIRGFCSLLGGGAELFTGRPLLSSYAFSEADSGVPNNYSLYLPLRMVAPDDEAARDRVRILMDRYGMGHRVLDRTLAAVSTRKLRDGVGLIPYVSLRTGPARPGITIYLSSEAYGTTPPRTRTSQLTSV